MPFRKFKSGSSVPASTPTQPQQRNTEKTDPSAVRLGAAYFLRQRFAKTDQPISQPEKPTSKPELDNEAQAFASRAGEKGGSVRSDRKARAARRNGRQGGRPPSR